MLMHMRATCPLCFLASKRSGAWSCWLPAPFSLPLADSPFSLRSQTPSWHAAAAEAKEPDPAFSEISPARQVLINCWLTGEARFPLAAAIFSSEALMGA